MFIGGSLPRHPDVKGLRNCRYNKTDLGRTVDHQVVVFPQHRASYILERGVWSARCRICGFTARDIKRSVAATSFLAHIRAMRLELRAEQEASS
jgi:hypothetical protein